MRGVLVTGGLRRIGRVICEELASRGYCPIIHSRFDTKELHDAAKSLNGYCVTGDLSTLEGAEKIFSSASDLPVELYGIVNNASLFSVKKEMAEKNVSEMENVNFFSPRFLLQKLAERANGKKVESSLVHLLDTRVLDSNFEKTPYAETKRKLFKSISKDAKEYAPYVRVNGVAPGPVLLPEGKDSSEKGGEILLPSRPEPIDVARAVLFLLEARSITGQVLAVDSGQCLISDRIKRA
ncbi:MAG: SDR family oxidoreductase [Kiritimatiellae bacterium]|nr:SDR family oxidoreductase [Kiritimatiellia bacterium]